MSDFKHGDQIPKVSLEMKELELDLFKEEGASSALCVKLALKLCTILFGERHTRSEIPGHISGFRQRFLSVARTPSLPVIDSTPSVLFLLEELSLSGSLDHARYCAS